jgi:MFS family permease
MKFDVFNSFRTLKYRNYKLYFSGQGISLIGTWIQIIAMNWLVYELSGSAVILGITGFLSRIPTVILAPFAGVIADRHSKFNLLFITQFLSMIQSALFTVLVFTGLIQIWQILLLGTLLGVINAFDNPIRQSFIVEIVEKKEDLPNAIALNSVLFNSARLIGPSIAGIILSLFGTGWCFLINTLSFAAILVTLLFMRLPKKEIVVSKKSPIKEMKEGFVYVFRSVSIRTILLALAIVSLMGMSFQVLMPVFAKDVLNGNANTLGFLMSSVGLGALVAGLILASRKTVLGLEKYIAFATTVFSVSLIIFAFSHNFYISIIALFFVGLGMIMQMASSNTLIQTLTDDDKRGRVMSFYSIAFIGTVPFGNLLAGTLASLIGESYAVMICGISSLITALYFIKKLPDIRKHSKPILERKSILPTELNNNAI